MPYLAFGKDLKVADFNGQSLETFDFKADELPNTSLSRIVASDYREILKHKFHLLASSGSPFELEPEIPRCWGHCLKSSWRWTP